MKLNGREFDPSTLDSMKNGELNWLLGVKYTVSQMSSLTKTQLIDEVRTLINAQPTRGWSPTVSKTKAVAQSKKCNLLKALRNGKTTVEHIRLVLSVDTVLRDYWSTVETDIR